MDNVKINNLDVLVIININVQHVNRIYIYHDNTNVYLDRQVVYIIMVYVQIVYHHLNINKIINV